ncbi:MAG: hypothetical protein F4X27_06735 [Chloroflexi bacterium]|nr:hypothetical protein [Chloroflexota bacterium]
MRSSGKGKRPTAREWETTLIDLIEKRDRQAQQEKEQQAQRERERRARQEREQRERQAQWERDRQKERQEQGAKREQDRQKVLRATKISRTIAQIAMLLVVPVSLSLWEMLGQESQAYADAMRTFTTLPAMAIAGTFYFLWARAIDRNLERIHGEATYRRSNLIRMMLAWVPIPMFNMIAPTIQMRRFDKHSMTDRPDSKGISISPPPKSAKVFMIPWVPAWGVMPLGHAYSVYGAPNPAVAATAETIWLSALATASVACVLYMQRVTENAERLAVWKNAALQKR